MRFADFLRFEHFADAQIHFQELVQRNFGFHRLHGVGVTVYAFLFDLRRFLVHRLFFFLGARGRKVKQIDITFFVNGIEEQVKPRAFFFVQQQPVDRLEKLALLCFQLFVGKVGAELPFRDGVKLRVQLVQREVVVCNIVVQGGNFRFFRVGKRFINLKIAARTQAVDLIRCAFFQPELRAGKSVRKFRILVGGADLFKHGFQHRYVEVDNGTELYQKPHRYGGNLVPRHLAVFHNRAHIVGRGAVPAVVQHFVKLEILAQNPLVKAEIKGFERLGFGVEPQDNLRFIEAKQGLRGHIQPGGAGHFAGCALDADKFIALEDRRVIAENLLGDVLAGVITAVDAGVIFPARLKIHAFIHPAHRPVNLPCQLAVEVFGKIKRALVAAGATIGRGGAVLRKGSDFRGVTVALRAIDADGVVVVALSLGGILRAVAVDDVKNLFALFQRIKYLIFVFAAPVHLCLVAIVHLNAEFGNRALKLRLEIRGIGGVFRCVLKGVGHVHIRAADIRLHIRSHGGNVYRHLAHPVKLVPREQQPRFFAHAPERQHDKITGGNITEVADVDRPGGADARRADIFRFVRVARNDALCNFFRPMTHKKLLWNAVPRCGSELLYIISYYRAFCKGVSDFGKQIPVFRFWPLLRQAKRS